MVDYQRSCGSKIAHTTYYGAYIALRKSQAVFNDPTLTIYSCGHCKGHHIGHNSVGNQIAERVSINNEKRSADRRFRRIRHQYLLDFARIEKLERKLTEPKFPLTSEEIEELEKEIEALDQRLRRDDERMDVEEAFILFCSEQLDAL